MRNFLLLLLLGITIPVFGQVNFESITWEQALKKSKDENKLIFLETYVTWSEPCQLLEKYALTDLEVSNYYNQRFVNLRLDMEEYPGIPLAETYEVSSYPTLLFLSSDGSVVHRGCGALEASEMLDLGREALGEDNFQSYQKKFEGGERSGTFLLSYLDLMVDGCLNAEGFAQKLLSEVAVENLVEEDNFLVLEDYQWDIFSREFKYLLENKDAFAAKLGVERVNNKLFNTFLAQYQEIYASEELHLFAMRAYLDQLGSASFTGADTLLTMAGLHYHELIEDWESFGTSAIDWVGMSGLQDEEELNDLAWKFYLFVENKEQLKIAAGWVKQIIDEQPTPSLIDTYASLMFKIGERKKAVELEKQAITMAIQLQEDTEHYEHQLKTFQKK